MLAQSHSEKERIKRCSSRVAAMDPEGSVENLSSVIPDPLRQQGEGPRKFPLGSLTHPCFAADGIRDDERVLRDSLPGQVLFCSSPRAGEVPLR